MCFCMRSDNVYLDLALHSLGNLKYRRASRRNWVREQSFNCGCYNHCHYCSHVDECIFALSLHLLRKKWTGASQKVCWWTEKKKRYCSTKKTRRLFKYRRPSKLAWPSNEFLATKRSTRPKQHWRTATANGHSSFHERKRQAPIRSSPHSVCRRERAWLIWCQRQRAERNFCLNSATTIKSLKRRSRRRRFWWFWTLRLKFERNCLSFISFFFESYISLHSFYKFH